METWVVVLIVIAVIALIIWGIVSMVHVLQEYERGVVFRLGKVRGKPKGPGLILLLPSASTGCARSPSRRWP